ncbi:MAG: transcription elongation factor GreB [Saccharospirillaceae bacterium]|jgi:transcription elongation factor GreB|nr:transcription elongation factor GreB [Thalassolituus sp. HI0120]KZZ46094.1 transcription elongation factor GreB [Thalassolituus sp. HI0120]MCH2040166.1 transcription elongation factor GreB [Saccharospirillaceae bacterium]
MSEPNKKPLPKRSLLITPEGAQALQEEHDYLWRLERPRVTQQVSDAAKLGDRSENAEYIYGKKRLRQIDSRLRFLRKRLEALTLVDREPADKHKVYFGAWIELEDVNEELYRYRIVGEDEIDLKRGYISVDAPLARGLLGKQLDDEVEILLPKGIESYYIVAVSYSQPNWDKGERQGHRWADNH